MDGRRIAKKAAYLVAAGALACLVFRIVFMQPGITQGNYTLLTSDLNGQYVNYLLYFRDAILNHKGLFYTFSGLLGTETAALIGYYLLSPLNILVLIFPAEKIATAVFWIVLSKVTLAGVTSALFFGRKNDYRWSGLLFSTTYAASGYIFAYFMHIMWLDSVYMLPLVAIGLEKLVHERKRIWYIVSLAYTFIVCYYTGYMVAGFCVLYFAYMFFVEKRSIKVNLKLAGAFALSSIAAGLLSCCTLVPTAFSQLGNREATNDVYTIRSVAQYLSKLFTGVFSMNEFDNGAPNMYFGMFVLLLLILRFMSWNRKMDLRKRICEIVFLLCFVLSFSIHKLDLVWHLLSAPHSFTFRYAFIFTFVILIFAEEFYREELQEITKQKLVFANLVVVGFAVYVLLQRTEAVRPLYIVIDIAAVISFSVLLFQAMRGKKEDRIIYLAFIGLVQIIVLCINGMSYMGVFRFDDHSTEGYYIEAKPVIREIQSKDKGLYRLEKAFLNSNNDGMMLSYAGFSFFSSSDKTFIRDFMGDLGYNQNYHWVYYDQGATLAGDSLLGMKYFVSKEEEEEFEKVGSVDQYLLYENPYALGLGIQSDRSIKEITLEHQEPFVNQQRIYSALLGETTEFFHLYEDYSIEASPNLKLDENGDSDYVFIRTSDEEGIITIRFTAVDRKPTYLFISSVYEPTVNLRVNGVDFGEYIATYHQGIMPIGSFEEGQEVELELLLVRYDCGFEEPQIASFDKDAFVVAAERLQAASWDVQEHDNTYIRANVSVEKDMAMFTSIPYQDSWKVYVDGEPVETYKICDTLLGFDLAGGAQEVELKFKLKGLDLGIVGTLWGIVALVGIALWEKKHEFA